MWSWMQQIICNIKLLRAQSDDIHFDWDAQTPQLHSFISIFYLEIPLHIRTKTNQYEYGLVIWPIAMLLAMFLERLLATD